MNLKGNKTDFYAYISNKRFLYIGGEIMDIKTSTDHVARLKDGQLWHFFVGMDSKLYYRIIDKNGICNKQIELALNVQKDFSLCIDQDGYINIIYHLNTGEVIYMKHNGTAWAKQILTRYNPLRYAFSFPNIFIVGKYIHILFAMGAAFNVGHWTLYHYFWNGQKWISCKITKFIAGKYLNPFHVDAYNNDLYVIYKALSLDRYQIFCIQFNGENEKWGQPENISNSITDCNMPSMLIKYNKLHVVWTVVQNGNLVVKYKKSDLPLSNNRWSEEIIISGSLANCSQPQLLWADDMIVCIWQQNEIIMQSASEDGDSWGWPTEVGWQGNNSFKIIKYCTCYKKDNVFKVNRIFANLYTEIPFPIIGKYINIHIIQPAVPVAKKSPTIHQSCDHYEEDKSSQDNVIDFKDKSQKHVSPEDKQDLAQNFNYIEQRLTFWMDKAKKNYEQSQSIMGEFEYIRNQFLENQKQWDMLIDDFQNIKQEVDLLSEKNFFKRLFSHLIKK